MSSEHVSFPSDLRINTRFLILSDTHKGGPFELPYSASRPYPKVDVLLHCGDLTLLRSYLAYMKSHESEGIYYMRSDAQLHTHERTELHRLRYAIYTSFFLIIGVLMEQMKIVSMKGQIKSQTWSTSSCFMATNISIL